MREIQQKILNSSAKKWLNHRFHEIYGCRRRLFGWRRITSGKNAIAIICSTSETAKTNDLNPNRYFELLLSQIPEHLDDHDWSFLDDLAPWSENLPAECRKQPD